MKMKPTSITKKGYPEKIKRIRSVIISMQHW